MSVPAPLNTRYSLHLLSTNTSDSSPSLLVTFDNHRYLFNAPESISRVCVQNKIGMRKMGRVFLGGLDNSAGLPGFILSSVEAGNSEIEVVAPEGIDHLVSSFRFYTRREQLSLKLTVPASYPTPSTDPSAPPSLPSPVFSDPNLIVYAFPLVIPSTATTVSSPSSNKRKRSSVSPSPPPRSKSPPAALETDAAKAVPSFKFDTSLSSFGPAQLRGAEATAWRQAVIGDMFRGKAFLPVPEPLLDSTQEDAVPVPLDTLAKYNMHKSAPSASYLHASLPPPSTKIEQTAISYLAVGPPLRGKFLPSEATKRGVKPGAAFSQLVAGQRVWVAKEAEVENQSGAGEKKLGKKEAARMRAEQRALLEANRLPDGEGEGAWVEPEDCLGEGQDAHAFLVLNLPSPDFLPQLLSIPSANFQSQPNSKLQTVISFLGPGVLHSPAYQSFISSFPSSIIHRITSPDLPNSNPVTFAPAALLTLRLSYVDPTIFSIPHYSFESSPVPTDDSHLFPSSAFPVGTKLFRQNDLLAQATTLKAHAGDIRTFDFDVPSPEATIEAGRLKSLSAPAETQEYSSNLFQRFLVTAGVVKEAVAAEAIALEGTRVASAGDDLKVTPLGTGSAVPSKYRNVSGTLLHLPGGAYALLDAGEGTWGQLARRFGEKGAEDVLRELKFIFISHMHQDHHAGLAKIMQRRSQLSSKPLDPLTILAPPGIRMYLHEQQHLFDLGLGYKARMTSIGSDVRFIDSYLVEAGRTNRTTPHLIEIMKLLGLKELVPVPVLHRCRCWGLSMEHESGWKVVFSGDTMPCDALVVAGKGATLLIHEATIEDELPDVARAKGHSTFGQAIDIARRMQAKYCLLTHFSARYPKLPPLTRRSEETIAGISEPIVAMAFDMCTIRLDEFWKMERYRDAMDILFEEAEEGSEVDAAEVTGNEVEREAKKAVKKDKGVMKQRERANLAATVVPVS